MPPLPKTATARRRTNRSSTARTLSAVHDVETPNLPKGRRWKPATKAWWAAIWASPMAPEFDDQADFSELVKLAMLEDDFWCAETASDRLKLAAEIRLQRQCFGLTPIDRRRLQWEIDRGESADANTRKRRLAASPQPEVVGEDPRRLLA